MPVENTNLALVGAAFHYEQICTGKGVAEMRPLLIRGNSVAPMSQTGLTGPELWCRLNEWSAGYRPSI
jgi:hypothetical protein